MKRVNDGYFKIIIYTIFSLILVMSLYLIILNIHHFKALSHEIVVTEADVSYTKFKKNINDIEDKLNLSSTSDGKRVTSLKRTLSVLKNGGVFRLLPNTKLSYHDLYILNDYFINDIINDTWVSSLKEINKDKTNSEMINILINNSNYLDNHFINNGLTLYDSYSEKDIENDYEMILNNYLSFSNVLLSLITS